MWRSAALGLLALAFGSSASAETARLSDAYRLIFSAGAATLAPAHAKQNAQALERLADLMRGFGARRDVRVLAQAAARNELAAQRLYAVRGALSLSYGVPFQKLESLGLTDGGGASAHLSFALQPETRQRDDCPWYLLLRHPGLTDGGPLRFAAGLEEEIHLPEGARLSAVPASPHPHSLAFAFTSADTGYVVGDDGAAGPADVWLTVSSMPIPMPAVSHAEPLDGSTQLAQDDNASRAVGNDIRPPTLVPAGPDSVTCSIRLVRAR